MNLIKEDIENYGEGDHHEGYEKLFDKHGVKAYMSVSWTIDKDSGTIISYVGVNHRERPVDDEEAKFPLEYTYKLFYKDNFYLVVLRGQKTLGDDYYQKPIIRLYTITDDDEEILIHPNELPTSQEEFLAVFSEMYTYHTSHDEENNRLNNVKCKVVFEV